MKNSLSNALILLYWYTTHGARLLGPWAMGGLLMLCTAALLWLRTLDLEQHRERLAQARAAATDQRVTVSRPEDTPEQRLAKFYARLPAREQVGNQVHTLFRIAKQYDLKLERARYQWRPDVSARIWEYHILLPVRGDYESIRGFVFKVLREIRFLELTQLNLGRKTLRSGELESRIRFTLLTQ